MVRTLIIEESTWASSSFVHGFRLTNLALPHKPPPPCPAGWPDYLLRQRSGAHERADRQKRRSSARQNRRHRTRARKSLSPQQQQPRSTGGAAAAPIKISHRQNRAPVASVVGEEEQEKQRGPGLGALGTSLNDGLYGGSTIDLGTRAASSVDFEINRGQGSLSVPAAAGTVRGDGSYSGASLDDTTNKSGESNGSHELLLDVTEACRRGLQAGAAAKQSGAPENDTEEVVQDKGKGGRKDDGRYGVDSFARSGSAGAAGTAVPGGIKPSAPNLKLDARTSSGGRRRVADSRSGSDGGGQRGHQQRARQHEGSSARPAIAKVMAGSPRKKQDIHDAVLGDRRKVGSLADISFSLGTMLIS